MYFITTKRMLEVCFSAHPNIQYRTNLYGHSLFLARDSFSAVNPKTSRKALFSGTFPVFSRPYIQ